MVGLLAIHAALLAWGAWVHSPTLNEPGHLAAGVSYWEFGRFDVYRVNPPLSRLVAALPVVAAGCKTDWNSFYEGAGARPELQIGRQFVAANGERSFVLFSLARWACIPFSLIGGLVCFLWSHELAGNDVAGLLALALWCFEPNIIAHGQLITPDMAAASLGLAAGYLYWRWLKRPTRGRALAAGALLGLAQLSKMTWVILFGLWPVIWVVWNVCVSRGTLSARQWMQQAGQLAVILFSGLYLLNLGYGFEGTLTRLKDYTFVSSSFTGLRDSGMRGNRFADSWLGELPVPLPRDYLLGMDLQKQDLERVRSSYLGGEWKQGGRWYFYLYGL